MFGQRTGPCSGPLGDQCSGRSARRGDAQTTGVGGFACALRTIPRILEVAHTMEEIAADGYLLNFTNPAGINTEAVIKHSKIKSVGLCNVPIGMIMEVIKYFGGEVSDIELDYVGLNHLSWVRQFKKAGQDITPEVLDKFCEHARDEWEEEATRDNMVKAIRSLNMFCNYYLQYFYSTDTVLKTAQGKTQTRGEEVVEIENALFKKYQDPNLSEKPEELGKRGGAHYSTAAFHLVDGIENDRQNRQIVCCRNNGAVPTFDDDVAVEVSAIVGKEGARAIQQEAPDHRIRGLMQLIKNYESLTVEAAVTGDREAGLHALLTNPLAPLNIDLCKQLLDDVLEINKEHLQDTFF